MALTNGYGTLEQVKERFGIRADDPSDSTMLESAGTAAARAIDQWCGRRFYAATETRYYTPLCGHMLRLPDDLRSITTLKTDENRDRTYEITWSSSTDYYLDPPNASLDGRPYEAIVVDGQNGRYTFPTHYRAVELAGSFGFNATGSAPADVTDAWLMLTQYLYKLKDAPGGVLGDANTGFIRIERDSAIMGRLWAYRRRRGWG